MIFEKKLKFFVKYHQPVVQTFSKSVLARGKSLKGKFTASIDFQIDRLFFVTIADVDIGSLKFLNVLFD